MDTSKTLTPRGGNKPSQRYCGAVDCCVGGSAGERGDLGGILYAVCTGVADRVRLCTCPAVYGPSTTETCLL